MKSFQPQPRFKSVAGLSAFAGLLGLAASLPAQSVSPVGTWDFALSGDQKGIAHITFNSDFTLDGREVVTYLRKAKADPDADGRGNGSGGPRVDGPSAGTNTITYFYGAAPIVGVWSYEWPKGIVGMYNEIGANVTNYVSFRGKQPSATRLNLVAHERDRKYQLRGLPQTPLPDLTGRYYVSGKRDLRPYVHVFDLDPDPTATLPNQYRLTTINPLYDPVQSGVALVSRHGLLGVVSRHTLPDDANESVLTSLTGPFSYTLTPNRGSVSGINELEENVKAKVVKVASPEVESN